MEARSTAEKLKAPLARLAAEGIFMGTSSWKYPGWLGHLYSEERYVTRGRFSKAKFESNCLAEYAEVFPAVCVDAGYYAFPTEKWLTGLAALVPGGFRFGFKVTDEVTIKRFPLLPRFGSRAGEDNPHFLDVEVFAERFLRPCEVIRPWVGPLIFEFSHFGEREFTQGRDFLPLIDRFLASLPRRWQYAVEIRNPSLLHPEYFAVLRSHGVAHCFNAWERMPPVSEQLAKPESRTTDFVAGRFLLSRGRKYEAAVSTFSPYTEVKAPDPEARESARKLVVEARKSSRRPSFLFINNRLEGNALLTILAVLESLSGPENTEKT